MKMLGNAHRAGWQVAALMSAVLALAGCEEESPVGGSGGTSAGEGGSAGTAGMSGEGGSAGTAGESGEGGSAGTAGTAGESGEGGSAGTAGEGGSAGTAGEGGTAGTAGEGGTAGEPFSTEPNIVTLSADGHDRLYGVTFDADGNIYATGQIADNTEATADYSLLVAKFTPNGEIDDTFGDDGVVTINVAVGGTNRENARGIVIQGNRIVICGEAEHDPDAAEAWARRDTDIVLVRFNIDGELDDTFGDDGIVRLDLSTGVEGVDDAIGRDTHYSLSLSGAKLVVHGTQRGEGDRAGMPGVARTDNDWVLVRLTADGGLDSTFSSDGKVTLDIAEGNGSARTATVLSDGSIIGVGYTNTTALGVMAQQPVLYKVLENGTFDATFATNDVWAAPGVWHDFATTLNAEAYGAALQGDHLVTMGYGPSPTGNNSTTDWVSFRFDANGDQDLTYGDTGATYIDAGGYGDNGRAVLVMPDGRVLGIGGGRPTPAVAPAMPNQAPTDAMLAMLNEDGLPDTAFALGGYRLYDLGGTGDFFWAGAVSPDETRVAIVGIAGAADMNDNDDGVLMLLSTGAEAATACNATIPTTWDNSGFAANAATELALRAQLQELNTRMQRGEDETATATVLLDLTTLFEAGNPSLRNAMTREYATVVSDVFDLFIPTVGQVLDPSTTWPNPDVADVGGRLCGPSPTPTGGCWNISAGGVDLRQIMEKGAFQAALYRQAHLRASGQVTPATIDQIAALFGANADFDVDGTNIHASNYAKSMGFYAGIRTHLIAAKAYAGEGATCQAELNGELSAALTEWEQSQYARFVYYANRAFVLFGAGTATDAQNAEALHWLGEGLGLVYGFKGLPTSARVITDEEIEEILMLMKMPTVQTATLYELLQGEADDLDDIEAVFDLVQEVYGFTDTQMNDLFRIMSPTAG